MLKPGTEIVVIIAQFPHILPVQFQWPNNVLASSAQATEHNGEPQKCCNEEGGSRVSLELLRVGAAGPPAAPEVGAEGSRTPCSSCLPAAPQGVWGSLSQRRQRWRFVTSPRQFAVQGNYLCGLLR